MSLFSVILATRDRPRLFGEALASVLDQRDAAFDVIVVNDGSSAAHLPRYERVLAEASARAPGLSIRYFTLLHRPNGHGQSYSLNYGVSQAQGEFLCFLDDDDRWTDPLHLARAGRILAETSTAEAPVDLYFTNQQAFISDAPVTGPVWLEALASKLQASGQSPMANGSYRCSLPVLLAVGGFCHINCLTVRRTLYEAIGGMDEAIRWECDHDLLLRLMDAASGTMLHHPAFTSRHQVPIQNLTLSMTTTVSMLEKRLYQLRVFNKAALFARHPEVRAYGRRNKLYALKKIAQELAGAGRWEDANFYARQALGANTAPKWLLFTLDTQIRRLWGDRQSR